MHLLLAPTLKPEPRVRVPIKAPRVVVIGPAGATHRGLLPLPFLFLFVFSSTNRVRLPATATRLLLTDNAAARFESQAERLMTPRTMCFCCVQNIRWHTMYAL